MGPERGVSSGDVSRPAGFGDSPRPPCRDRDARGGGRAEGGVLGAERDQPESAATEAPAQAVGVGADFVLGLEAKTRNATEAGNLLGKSPASLGVVTQKRSTIVNDPRLRGNRIGSLFSSGSYWVPARIDLDTMLSKIDARLIDDIITVNGPYAARYGPGFSFVDFELLPTPRYSDGFQAHGSTSFDYKVNGQGWYGLQTLWGGNADWGFRAAYGHRTGNDYTTGAGAGIPSSYNSRDASVALGRDLDGDRSIEFNYLRLDQTGVEFPGQAFDIDVLATDGTEVTYVAEDQANYDRLQLDVWFNDTRFAGSAQRPGKRRQFPFYDVIDFVGFTNVESLSTGFRSAVSWDGVEGEHLTVGADLRYVLQELNEITSGRIGFNIWDEANSPVPKSYFANPGVFAEYGGPVGDYWTVTIGARGDLVANDVIDDPAKLASLGTQSTPQEPISLADIVGSDDWDRTFGLWSLYATGQYAISDGWTAELAAGYAQRPPTLTELYVAESFMYVLQNGLNILTGDPRLEPEQLCQIDLGLRYDSGRFRGEFAAFTGGPGITSRLKTSALPVARRPDKSNRCS